MPQRKQREEEGPKAEARDAGSGEQNESPGKQSTPIPVVGLGASAGGIEALRTFFSNIPPGKGIAFVVIVHLSPEHPSNLSEVLRLDAAIPVIQLSGDVEIEADHVYVIPPNKNLGITATRLSLSDFEEPRGQRSPIDHFFRTLAAHHPDGIAVVLSGGGTDGTVGMKAVKENGGMLLVQSPEDAKFDSMPRSAIATGLVDFVLPAADLARKVVELSTGEIARLKADALPAGEAAMLQSILSYVCARTGSDFSSYKRSTVMRRIARRMRVNHVEDIESYFRILRADDGEADALMQDLLISVTSFFRDEEAFAALEQLVFPKILAKTDTEEVRVWVPGCATGEEAYSLAILLIEWTRRMNTVQRVQIFASDLDARALTTAREGRYPDAIATDVSEARLRGFFVREGDYYRVKQEVREVILFAPHNLLRDPPFSRLHLVSCRNLLMYLERSMQKKVFEVFHYALLPEGYLFLGTAENADVELELFSAVDKQHRIYRRIPDSPHSPTHLPDLPLRAVAHEPIAVKRPQHKTKQNSISSAQHHREALELYAPPSILVDQKHQIVHVSESASRYLQYPGGSPTSNLLKVARNEFQAELRSGLYQAFVKNLPSLCTPITLKLDGEPRLVQVYVTPARHDESRTLALVVFSETAVPDGEAGATEVDGGPGRLRRLEEEIDSMRDQLYATMSESETQQEELRAANEELLSINEEYKSTLEEFETSKEELQSINEELHTVNQELNEKVEALRLANDDLKNFMEATDVASVFIDRDLRIKSFTSALAEIVNVSPTDVGRPLYHLTHRLQYQDLTADAKRVMETSNSFEREVRRDDGRVYFVRLAPYRTTDNQTIGAVLSAVDLTPLKSAEEELRRSEQRYRLLVNGVAEYAIFTTDPEGRIDLWNSGAIRLFGYGEDEALGRHLSLIYTEGDRKANVPSLEMETARREGAAADERWHVRKDGTKFWGSGTTSPFYDEQGSLTGFAKILRDNTQELKASEELRKGRERLTAMNQTLEQRILERTRQVREMNERVRRLATDLMLSEQRERHRLATLLHDDLQQQLFGIQIKLSLLRQGFGRGEMEQVQKQIAEASGHLAGAIEQTRQLTFDLSPPVLREDGLQEALEWLSEHVKSLHGLEVEFTGESLSSPVSDEKRVLLFHVTRELLFNVVKHADTERAEVKMYEEKGNVVIQVADSGRGFILEERGSEAEFGSGFGLYNVGERVNLVGGEVEIDTSPGKGTRVSIRVPISDRHPI